MSTHVQNVIFPEMVEFLCKRSGYNSIHPYSYLIHPSNIIINPSIVLIDTYTLLLGMLLGEFTDGGDVALVETGSDA